MLVWPDVLPFSSLFACAILLAAPAHAQDLQIARASVARDAGNLAEAIQIFRSLAKERPQDADIIRQLGTNLAFARQYTEAITTLLRAHAIAPHDQDISLALSRVYLWSGRLDDAGRVAADITAVDPTNPEISEILKAIASAKRDRPAVTVALAETASWVDIGTVKRRWYETSATVAVPLGIATVIGAGVDVEDRGTATDTRITLRADRRVGQLWFYLGANTTPRATFREQWSAIGGGLVPITPLVTASIDLRHAHYDSVDVTVVEPAITLHSREDRVSLSIHSINLWGEGGTRSAGWSIRGEAACTKAVQIFAGAATYPDTEAGITKRVHSAYAGVKFPISGRLGGQLVVDRDDRRDSYRRTGLTFGLRWRMH